MIAAVEVDGETAPRGVVKMKAVQMEVVGEVRGVDSRHRPTHRACTLVRRAAIRPEGMEQAGKPEGVATCEGYQLEPMPVSVPPLSLNASLASVNLHLRARLTEEPGFHTRELVLSSPE